MVVRIAMHANGARTLDFAELDVDTDDAALELIMEEYVAALFSEACDESPLVSKVVAIDDSLTQQRVLPKELESFRHAKVWCEEHKDVAKEIQDCCSVESLVCCHPDPPSV